MKRILGALLFSVLPFACVFSQAPNTWPFVGNGNSPFRMEVDPQNNFLYVGGNFLSINNANSPCVARYDGANWWAMGQGFGGVIQPWVTSFSFYNGVIAAGNFLSSGNTPVNYIAEWNGTSWQPLPGGGTDSMINCLVTYNGELYAGGSFTQAGNVSSNYIAKWNGTSWSAVNTSGLSQAVVAMTIYNGALYVASGNGIFMDAGNGFVNCGNFLSSSGNVYFYCLIPYGGELYASGVFDGVQVGINYTACNNIARLGTNGWSDVGGFVSSYFYYPVTDMMVCGNKLFIDGDMDSINNSLYANGFAMWDGTNWSTLNSGPSAAGGIRVFHGDIYASMRNGVMKYDTALCSVNETTVFPAGIFPDPCSNKISTRLPQNKKMNSVVFFDVNGKELKRYPFFSEYDVSEFAPGIYFVEAIADDGQRYMAKFVKQ